MTTLDDAARELAEAEAAVWGERCTSADLLEAAIKNLIAAVRTHDALATGCDPADVVARYDDGLTIRLRGVTVDADAATGRLEVAGWLTPGSAPWRAGDGIRLAHLGIPGRGALADITAGITVSMRLNVIHVRIRVQLDPEERP